MISQLNEYYGDCVIDENNQFIGAHYLDVQKIIEEKAKLKLS